MSVAKMKGHARLLGAEINTDINCSSKYLPGKELWITEFGWTTHPPSALQYLPERLRPRYISQTLAALGHVNCGVAAVTLYTWVTPERDRTDLEDWFGIHSPSLRAVPLMLAT